MPYVPGIRTSIRTTSYFLFLLWGVVFGVRQSLTGRVATREPALA